MIVVSAHLDHEGVKNGEVYNGADDDGSGTVAVLQIADAFKQAAKDGNGPKRSILFLHVTGEEKGLLGSQYYTDFDPIVPLANTVADLNIDMMFSKIHIASSAFMASHKILRSILTVSNPILSKSITFENPIP